MKRRNNLDISAELLKIAEEGARKSHLVYQANVNFQLIEEYLKRFVRLGMLIKDGPFYHTTEKGREYIDLYGQMIGLFM